MHQAATISSSAARVLTLLFCGCTFAQQQIQVENAASLLTGDIAAGSLVKVQLIYQGGPITPIDPSSVSAQILSVGSQDPLALSVLEVLDATSVLVLIPSATPVGPASITLSYNGQTATQIANIVATSFGLYSAGGEAALAQNIKSNGIQLNNLTHPAHPQDFVTLWGTGLGPATADQVTVLLGGHPFPVAYAGPSGDYAGLDQINFQVPDDPAIPQGCYVAVNVEIGNTTSNLETLSLSPNAGPCAHPFGLTADELAALDSGGQVYLGQINLYSTIGPPTGPSLSPANGYVRMESANAQFLSYNAGGLSLISQPLFADDYLAGCTLTGGAAARLLGFLLAPLNVGDQVNIQGLGAQLTLTGAPFYSASLPTTPAVNSPDQLPAPFFSAGQWQASAPGASNVQPFTATLSIPNPIQITNYSQLTMVDHTQDLTIAWDPTTYSRTDFVTVQLYPAPLEWFNTSAVLCRVPALAGQATIPAALLASFQPSATGSLTLSIARDYGAAGLFTIGLSDGTSIPGAFQDYSTEWILVQFF
jgi:uncharacterized protein (TIGR03437 family)